LQKDFFVSLKKHSCKQAAIEDALDKTQTHKTCCLVQ
jgi:hypothetical protein